MSDQKRPAMTVRETIIALQNLENQDAPLTFNIMQGNKAFGVIQLQCETNPHFERPYDRYPMVSNNYGGSITLWLPDGAFIAQRKK